MLVQGNCGSLLFDDFFWINIVYHRIWPILELFVCIRNSHHILSGVEYHKNREIMTSKVFANSWCFQREIRIICIGEIAVKDKTKSHSELVMQSGTEPGTVRTED